MDRRRATPERVRPALALWILLALFVAGLLPFAGTFLEHYPDERNYTNAAITMVNTGEWVTPRWPDGHPNVHKPIIAYWLVAGSYALFGVGLPASRIPFMLAGAAVIGLAYVAARRFGAAPATALLAAVITLAEPQLILASMRAIPDVLLCLFMLVSAYGFISLIALGQRDRHLHWAAYVGAGLAIQTKGLLGLVFVVFAWVYAWLDPSRGPAWPRLRPLIHLPSMLVGLAVASWWYIAMYALHGPGPSAVFVGDQITWNLKVLDGSPLLRIPAYFGSLFTNLLPWSLLLMPLAVLDRRCIVPTDPDGRRVFGFVIAWSALLPFVFGLGGKLEPRYVLPVAPLWAILLAGALYRADPQLSERWIAYLRIGALSALAVFGVAGALLDWSLLGPRRALVDLGLFAAALVLVAAITRGPRGLPRAAGVSLAVFAAFPLAAIALGPALESDLGVRLMARALERSWDAGGGTALVAGPEHFANKLRVLTRGRVPIDSWSPLPADRSRWPRALILPAADPAARDLTGYATGVIATEVRSIPVMGLLHAMWTGRAPEFLDSRRARYLVAIRERE